MKPSFFVRFSIAIFLITTASLLIVWILMRPKYEESMILSQLISVRKLQDHTMENIDQAIVSWSTVSRFIASQVMEHPKDGELILRSMMALHPEIVEIKISSPKFSDELASENVSYPSLNLQINDSVWFRSKLDNTLQIAWLNRTELPQYLCAMQTQFQVQNIPFIQTIIWDAKRLNEVLTGIPLGQDYSLSVHSTSHVIMHNNSTFRFSEVLVQRDPAGSPENIRQGNITWHILTRSFRSVPVWMIIAVPEKQIIKLVEYIMISFTSLIASSMLIVMIVGWILSRQMNRHFNKMKNEMIYNSEQ